MKSVAKSRGNGALHLHWGRFFMDESEASQKALKMLMKSSLLFITFPVSGSLGPRLNYEGSVYFGTEEIRKFLKSAVTK